MSVGAATAIGAVVALALGILVSVSSDIPIAPEIELVMALSSDGFRAGGACSSRGLGGEPFHLVAEGQDRWPAK